MVKKSKKYEVANINETKITIDVSLITADELSFNATEIAKQFGKLPKDFLKTESTTTYIQALARRDDCPIEAISSTYTLIKKGGKYQGTWLHKDLALQFARWLDADFAVELDSWTIERLTREHHRQKERLEARTGYLPMTNAILYAHDTVKFYHFSNEADMINRIMLGMSASKYREEHEVPNVRDALNAAQLKEMSRLQMINTGLIEVGMDFQERKEKLTKCHAEGLLRLER